MKYMQCHHPMQCKYVDQQASVTDVISPVMAEQKNKTKKVYQ